MLKRHRSMHHEWERNIGSIVADYRLPDYQNFPPNYRIQDLPRIALPHWVTSFKRVLRLFLSKTLIIITRSSFNSSQIEHRPFHNELSKKNGQKALDVRFCMSIIQFQIHHHLSKFQICKLMRLRPRYRGPKRYCYENTFSWEGIVWWASDRINSSCRRIDREFFLVEVFWKDLSTCLLL